MLQILKIFKGCCDTISEKLYTMKLSFMYKIIKTIE
jgi:hypothetical protein